jgi:hypothetical protein
MPRRHLNPQFRYSREGEFQTDGATETQTDLILKRVRLMLYFLA